MTDESTPSAAAPAADAGKSTLAKKVQIGVGIMVAIVFGLITIAKIITWNDLPGCDSKVARDSLSDLFKQHKIEATRYNEIKTITTSKDEVTCSASLALKAGTTLSIDYRLFYEDGKRRIRITRADET